MSEQQRTAAPATWAGGSEVTRREFAALGGLAILGSLLPNVEGLGAQLLVTPAHVQGYPTQKHRSRQTAVETKRPTATGESIEDAMVVTATGDRVDAAGPTTVRLERPATLPESVTGLSAARRL